MSGTLSLNAPAVISVGNGYPFFRRIILVILLTMFIYPLLIALFLAEFVSASPFKHRRQTFLTRQCNPTGESSPTTSYHFSCHRYLLSWIRG